MMTMKGGGIKKVTVNMKAILHPILEGSLTISTTLPKIHLAGIPYPVCPFLSVLIVPYPKVSLDQRNDDQRYRHCGATSHLREISTMSG